MSGEEVLERLDNKWVKVPASLVVIVVSFLAGDAFLDRGDNEDLLKTLASLDTNIKLLEQRLSDFTLSNSGYQQRVQTLEVRVSGLIKDSEYQRESLTEVKTLLTRSTGWSGSISSDP